MPYEQELDAKIECKEWENESTKLSVNIYSYNNGPKKLQISRENKNANGEYKFAKLGRLSKEEAVAILPLMQEIVPALD